MPTTTRSSGESDSSHRKISFAPTTELHRRSTFPIGPEGSDSNAEGYDSDPDCDSDLGGSDDEQSDVNGPGGPVNYANTRGRINYKNWDPTDDTAITDMPFQNDDDLSLEDLERSHEITPSAYGTENSKVDLPKNVFATNSFVWGGKSTAPGLRRSGTGAYGIMTGPDGSNCYSGSSKERSGTRKDSVVTEEDDDQRTVTDDDGGRSAGSKSHVYRDGIKPVQRSRGTWPTVRRPTRPVKQDGRTWSSTGFSLGPTDDELTESDED